MIVKVEDKDIYSEVDTEGVLTLVLNRPRKRNALSSDVLQQIIGVLSRASDNPNVKAVVVYGGENLFAAGADLNELLTQKSTATWLNPRPQLWQQIEQFEKPLIAAVNGYALGAGLELVLMCDIVIAGDNCVFGLPEITLGLMPGAGGTQRLARTVGKSMANQMVLTGQPIDAQKALSSGLVSEVTVVENTLIKAQKVAKTIAQHAPLAIKAAKTSLKSVPNSPLNQGLLMERQLFSLLAETQDREEGIQAFLSKRKPTFKGI